MNFLLSVSSIGHWCEVNLVSVGVCGMVSMWLCGKTSLPHFFQLMPACCVSFPTVICDLINACSLQNGFTILEFLTWNVNSIFWVGGKFVYKKTTNKWGALLAVSLQPRWNPQNSPRLIDAEQKKISIYGGKLGKELGSWGYIEIWFHIQMNYTSILSYITWEKDLGRTKCIFSIFIICL